MISHRGQIVSGCGGFLLLQYLVSSVVVLPNVVLVSISRPLVIHREMLPHWLTALLLPTSVPVSGRRKPIMWALVTFTSAVGSRPSGVRSPFNAAKGPALFELLELPANGQLPTWSVSLLRSCILLPITDELVEHGLQTMEILF